MAVTARSDKLCLATKGQVFVPDTQAVGIINLLTWIIAQGVELPLKSRGNFVE